MVDGNSSDGTSEIIRREFPSVRLLSAAYAERSFQLNLGGFEASGDVLLFAHADMQFPAQAIDEVRSEIRQGAVGGGFKKRYQPNRFFLSVYGYSLNTIYLSWMRCLVGTNAIFVRRDIFEKLDGFPEMPFLEDVVFSDRLCREGPVAVLETPVTVSSRRYLSRGILRQILCNMQILLGYKVFRKNLDSLAERYQKVVS